MAVQKETFMTAPVPGGAALGLFPAGVGVARPQLPPSGHLGTGATNTT